MTTIKENKLVLICLIAAVFAIVSVAKAETTTTMTAPANAVSTAPAASASGASTVDAKHDTIWSHTHLHVFSNFHGPALNHLDAAETVDSKGKLSKSAMYFDTEAALAYALDDKMSIAVIYPFFIYARGEHAQSGDAGLRLSNKKVFSGSNYSVNSNFAVQFSTSDYSRNRGQDIAFKFTPNGRYIFQGTRFSMGAWTEAKAYVGVTSGKAFKLWASPYLSYQMNPTVSFNMNYEMETDHFANKGEALDFQAYQSDLMPNVVFNITPSFMVNPYLQIYTNDKISTDRMALGALISAAL